jgi:hypothetical protein
MDRERVELLFGWYSRGRNMLAADAVKGRKRGAGCLGAERHGEEKSSSLPAAVQNQRRDGVGCCRVGEDRGKDSGG